MAYGLTITWSAPHSATPIASYDVEYRAYGSTDFASWEHTDNTTTTMITGLAPSTVHHVRVRAVNEVGAGDWSPTGQGTTDNAVPEFVEGDAAARSFPENAPAGVAVGAPVAATDPEGGPLRYTLGGEDAASVDLDVASGQLRTRADAGYDHETDAELVVTVTVDDGHGGVASIEVTIAVTDVDEPPAAPDAPTVDDSDGQMLVVTWTAPDNTGRPPITPLPTPLPRFGGTVHHVARVADGNPRHDHGAGARHLRGAGAWRQRGGRRRLVRVRVRHRQP